MHEDDVAHCGRLIAQYPKLTPSDLTEWSDKPIFEALKSYDSKRFWANAERAARTVESWPDWMKGSRENKRGPV